MKINHIFMRYVQLFRFLMLLALLLCGTAYAAHYNVVTYMGHSQVFMFVVADDGEVQASSIKGCGEDGYLWGDPSNMACNNSPVIVFNEALKDISGKWKLMSEADTCSAYVGIAAKYFYADGLATLTADPVTECVNGYPEDTQAVLKRDVAGQPLKKDERFKRIFSGLIEERLNKLKVDKIVLDDEHVLIRKMAEDLTGKDCFDLFHSATCGVPYYYRKGVITAVTLPAEDQKACGHFELGFLSRKHCVEVANIEEKELKTIESGDRYIKEKGTPFQKAVNADGYVRDYHQYPAEAEKRNWNHKKFPNKHCFHRWMYAGKSFMVLTDVTKGFGMNEFGTRILTTCTGANKDYCCDSASNTAFVTSDLYEEAKKEAVRQVCDYPLQSMAKVITRDFRSNGESSSYPSVTDTSEACPIVIAGEFSYALPDMQGMLVEKLDDYDKGRVRVIAGDEFLRRLPIAGVNLLKEVR